MVFACREPAACIKYGATVLKKSSFLFYHCRARNECADHKKTIKACRMDQDFCNQDAAGVDWVAALCAGQESGMNCAFELYLRRIFIYVHKILGDEHEAQDITQVTFVRLWENREKMNSKSHVEGFLHTTAYNLSISYLRAQKRETGRVREFIDRFYSGEPGITEVELAATDLLLKKHIQNLSPALRVVIELIYFEHKKPREIAKQLGINEQSVLNQKTRALDKLREVLPKGLFLLFLVTLEIIEKKVYHLVS